VTENGAFKKEVRARAARTGEKYTEALRRTRGERGRVTVGEVEPHYAFVPPRSIFYVDEHVRRPLQPPANAGPAFGWGYGGSGPLTSAKALLLDATGSFDQHLAIAFVSDNLRWWEETGRRSFVLTVAEVRAWRRENEARVELEAAGPRTYSAQEFAAKMVARLAEPPRRPWWQEYRERHGEPRVVDTDSGATTLIAQALEKAARVKATGRMNLLTEGVPLSLEESTAFGIYTAARSMHDGYDDDKRLNEFRQLAEAVGLEQAEIDAAIEAARKETT
jgi:hypothetical protein